MAIIALDCPHCGGELKLDESKESGFCIYCGAKIMIQEEVQKIKVIHTGAVTIDESKKTNNYYSLANAAFSGKNYTEAYQYYAKTMECDSTHGNASFYKGLCAGYLSTPAAMRFDELVGAYGQAVAQLTGSNALNQRFEMLRFVYAFCVEFYEKNCVLRHGFEFPDVESARQHFAAIDRLITLCIYAVELTGNDAASQIPGCEDTLRQLIEFALSLCKAAREKVSYCVGMKTVKEKNGAVHSEKVIEKCCYEQVNRIPGFIEKLNQKFNTLPSTVSAIGIFDTELAQNQAIVDDYEQSLAAFFTENPEDEKTYRRPGLFGAKKKRAEIEQKFSPELLGKMERAKQSKDAISDITHDKKRYIKANTK